MQTIPYQNSTLTINNSLPSNSTLGDPVYARVRERLRQEILSGVFEAGVRLKIAELSHRYAVSQMPIREALQQLQGEGLIVIEPNKGAMVRRVDERLICNMYDIRIAIDAVLVRLSVSRFSQADLEVLQTIQYDFEAAARENQIDQCLIHNQRFHRVIYQVSDNPVAWEIVERHWGLIDSLRRKYKFGHARIPGILREHRELIAVLEKRDADAAVRVIQQHCEKSKLDLLEQMRSG